MRGRANYPPFYTLAELAFRLFRNHNSMGVIIINSTVGCEALLLKKPLIVLGHETYMEVGVNMKDLSALPVLLSSIKTGEFRVDAAAYDAFLKKYAGHIIPIADKARFASELKAATFWPLKNG